MSNSTHKTETHLYINTQELIEETGSTYRSETTRVCFGMQLNSQTRFADTKSSCMRFGHTVLDYNTRNSTANDNFEDERDPSASWVNFYANGTYSRPDGRFLFRTPLEFRRKAVVEYLQGTSALPQPLFFTHMADMDAGRQIVDRYDYDDIILGDRGHGQFSGIYIAEKPISGGVEFHLLHIVHVLGEPFHRTRSFLFHVDGHNTGQIDRNITCGDVKLVSCSDGLAAFGDGHGYIWPNALIQSHRTLECLNWMSKGRRCTSFRSKSPYFGSEPALTYQLVRYPAQVEIALDLLYT